MAEWVREMSVGEWYQPEEGEPFEIVGIDPKAEVVLVQHFDGTLEEFDFDSWMELRARPCAPPEDVSGALDLDRNDRQDFGMDTEIGRADRWQDPLDFLDTR
ncbi:MAG: hypothetical protein HYV18_01960 [Gammaproteobacteria bacterium]|nr:hypothetical protein [Gammaproteobacteria bacterium]